MSAKAVRNSNLELYRVIVMVLIVAHHYFVNSGLIELASTSLDSFKSIYLYLFGMWGKTGINCFVLITGYFMCTSSISLQKFIKLMFEVYLYRILIFLIFWICGYEYLNTESLTRLILPVSSVADNFTGCFILFWLTIPFLNVLVRNLTQRQHLYLLGLSLTIYVILPLLPYNRVVMNYVTWFIILYIISSYIRMYNVQLFSNKTWGWLALLLVFISMFSVLVCLKFNKNPYWFVSDSNAILAVLTGVCSFMFFKDLTIPYSKFVNALGASTFGVLLIHANSDAMRTWLWRNTLHNVGWFQNDTLIVMAHSIISVILVYSICSLIDWLRIKYIEKPFFSRFGSAIDKLQNRIFAS